MLGTANFKFLVFHVLLVEVEAVNVAEVGRNSDSGVTGLGRIAQDRRLNLM